jgi:N-acetylmuramoyl-L-alanine amidase
MKILIDPGHPSRAGDSGAVGRVKPLNPPWNDSALVLPYSGKPDSLPECWANLNIAVRLKNLLSRTGHEVSMTRRDGSAVSLTARQLQAVREKPDAFVSIHCNSSTVPQSNGFEVWVYTGHAPSERLAVHPFGDCGATSSPEQSRDEGLKIVSCAEGVEVGRAFSSR